uniref:Uncharacterized protein n=1 Tax=Noctiluca scintillans TaxID=2966 RepID=A0A7S1AAX6_NOCSC
MTLRNDSQTVALHDAAKCLKKEIKLMPKRTSPPPVSKTLWGGRAPWPVNHRQKTARSPTWKVSRSLSNTNSALPSIVGERLWSKRLHLTTARSLAVPKINLASFAPDTQLKVFWQENPSAHLRCEATLRQSATQNIFERQRDTHTHNTKKKGHFGCEYVRIGLACTCILFLACLRTV